MEIRQDTVRKISVKYCRGQSDGKETIEQKIEKTEKAISRNREQYDRLTAELEELHKKKKAIQNEELLRAIAVSTKSYEEILHFIQEKPDNDNREEARHGKTTTR